jgi:type II secretory pathway component PulF
MWHEQALRIAEYVQELLPWFWLVLVVLIVAWLYRSARAISHTAGGLGRFPTAARVLYAGRMATFAELLALLVEQEVPMSEAVVLAGAASGDARLRRGGKVLAEHIRQGGRAAEVPEGFPPLLGWLILTETRHTHLVKSLRQTGDAYRRKALYWGNWLGVYLPVIVSAGIGGVVALFYVLLVLAPFYNLLFQFCRP